LAGLKTMD